MTDSNSVKSHKEWRRLAKKMRRKRIRQELAEARNKQEKIRMNSSTYLTELAKNKLLEEYELEEYERERRERHEKWLKDEEEAQRLWKEQQRLKQLAHEDKMKELERIRREWESEQEKIRKKKEELQKAKDEEEKRKQEIMERINDFIVHGGEVPPELQTVRETNSLKEPCSFFSKVGACRFGSQCSRNHQYPGISRVLLFTNFYSHFTLDQNHKTEYDTDIGLEFEDCDMYLHFKEFYKDVAPELKKYGNVKMIKVCCNTEIHLRGNVYVEYGTLREALVAYQKFHGRWYGSKQLNVEFVNITDWGRAVCGDFARNRCPKGKSCNFLHVFKNPRNEFPIEWNKQKNVSNHSVSESFDDCEGSMRGKSFRWSESPEHQIIEKRSSSQHNGYKHMSRNKNKNDGSRYEKEEKRRIDNSYRKRKSRHSERLSSSSSKRSKHETRK